MVAQAGGEGLDRRDALRRRIYLLCLIVGTPVLAVTWVVHRLADPFIAVAYPPYVASLTVVAIGLVVKRLAVRDAERVVLISTALVYLTGLAVAMLGAQDLADLRDEMTVSSLLTVNLIVMLAYVAFETQQALRVSLAVFGAFVGIVAVGVVPEVVAGRAGGAVVDYLRAMMFLGASVALLHVLAQVKEQAAEARSTAAAMTALANTDALTGVPNRRQLHTVLDERILGAGTTEHPLAVILLDIDHFKRINDTHGHDSGDAVLRQVAATLTDAVRASDHIGRWGGEEFLVIAPDTGPADAAALAERCRARLAATSFPTVGRVTASLGVAMYTPGDTAWPLLRRADDALYLAKAAGRDRVHHHAEGWAAARPRDAEPPLPRSSARALPTADLPTN